MDPSAEIAPPRKRPGRKPGIPGRKRYERQSTGKRVSGEEPRDLLTYQLLQKHGPLPTPLLHLGTKHLNGNKKDHQRRMADLYHEDNTPYGGPMLDRLEPHWPYSDGLPDVYGNTARSEKALEKRGLLYRYAVPTGGPLPHRVMTACLTFSIEYHATRAGFRFISQEEILASPDCPEETRREQNPLAMPISISYTFPNPRIGYKTSVRPIIPDALFGIQRPTGECRYFALEADRDTENFFRPDLDENSYLRKLLGYRYITQHRIYERRFGIKNFLVLNYTTNHQHMFNLVEEQLKLEPKGVSNMLFQAYPLFDRPFKLPTDALDVFTTPYHRAGHPDIFINK